MKEREKTKLGRNFVAGEDGWFLKVLITKNFLVTLKQIFLVGLIFIIVVMGRKQSEISLAVAFDWI